MIDYIRGILTSILRDSIVLEVNGLGYDIHVNEMSLQGVYKYLREECIIYTQVIFRETEQLLYGFLTRQERDCFRLLISFSGVGAKVGLAIMNSFHLKQLCQIAKNEDVKALASVPGIGKKTAEKLMVDLKQKLPNVFPLEGLEDTIMLSKQTCRAEEGIHALVALGYNKFIAEKMILEALKDLPEDASISQVLPIALKKTVTVE